MKITSVSYWSFCVRSRCLAVAADAPPAKAPAKPAASKVDPGARGRAHQGGHQAPPDHGGRA